MATRVNTRFVFGLFAALAAIVLAMVGLWFVFVRQDVGELMRRGDAMMTQGRPDQALHYYGPALQQERTNLALIDRYVEALTTVSVDDRLTAEQYVGQIREWMRRAAELRPQDHSRLESFYALEHRLAEDAGGGEAYNRLHELARARLAADPDHPVARKYRGISQLHRLTDDAPASTRRQVGDDLEAAAEHYAQDAEVLYHLALWHAIEAQRARQHNGYDRAEELGKEAMAISRRMLETEEDAVRRQLLHLRLLTHPGINAFEEARSVARQLAADLVRDSAPTRHVLEFTELLPRIESEPIGADHERYVAGGITLTRGLVDSWELLEEAVAANPDDVALLARLGRARAIMGERSGAIEAFETVRRIGQSRPPMQYVRNRQILLQATMQLADLLLTRADQARSDDDRREAIETASDLIEQLRRETGEMPGLAMLRGKLALLRGQFAEAAVHLDRAMDQHDQAPPSLLVLSSSVHQRLGNWGTAADRLEEVLQQRPGMNSVRLELARLLLERRQLDDAERHIEHLLAHQDGQVRVDDLHVRLLALRGDLEAATALYQSLEAGSQGELLRPLVRAYLAAGQRDEALALIDRRLTGNPADLRAVHLMIEVNPDEARSRQVIAAAEAQGADPTVLSLLARQLDQDQGAAVSGLMAQLLDQAQGPLQRSLLRVQLARRRGDESQLRAALHEAVEADADDPRVIELQFELALYDEDWAQAERLARAAGEHELDQAHGAFFDARLAEARGDLTAAISHYRRGLSAREVYAEGWRRFGDVLVRKNDLAAAANAYRRVIDQQPDNLDARRGLAAIYERQHERQRALEQLRAAIHYAPADAALLAQHALYEQLYGRPELAVDARKRLAQVEPDNADNSRALVALLLNQQEHEEALAWAEKLIKEAGATHDNVSTLAIALRDTGDIAGGERALREYLQQRGDEATAEDYALLARYRLSVADNAGALEAYRQAMAREDRDRKPITRQLAHLMFSRGMYPQAATLYAQLYETDASDTGIALRYGEALVRAGRLERAEHVLEGLEEMGPTLALRGLLAGQRGDIEKGRRLLSEAIDRDEGTPSLYFERARLHAGVGDFDEAISDLQMAIEGEMELLPAHELLGELHARLGEHVRALEAYGRVLDHAPANHSARQRFIELHVAAGDAELAMRLAREAAELFPNEPAWPRLWGTLALRQGDESKAVELFRRVVELTSEPRDVAQLATLQLNLDAPADVLELLREHARMTSEQPVLQARRARALAALERLDEAERAFELALNACRRPQQTVDVARRMVEALGVEAALERLGGEDVDGSEYDAARLLRELGAASVEVQSGMLESAMRRMERYRPLVADADTDTRWFFYTLLARTYHRSGSYPEASAVYEKLLDMRPNDLVTLNDLAYLLVESGGDTDRALVLAQRAAAQAPHDARVLDTLGWAEFHAGDLDAARLTLERALDIEPLAEAHLHLGMVYASMGRGEDAHKQFERAADLAEQAGKRAVLHEATERLEGRRVEVEE